MKLSQTVSKHRNGFWAFAVIFAALVLRVSWFGFEYYYQLDDYIHFRQLAEGTDIIRLCIDNGYFSSRPLAVLTDFVIWSPMNHYVAAVVICAMYAGAAVLYWDIFRRHFGTGWFFVVFFTLLPLGFEGTYWLAASTRIVPPLLLSAVALWCLDRFVDTKQHALLPVFLLCSLLSFTLYEQMLVLSLTLSLLLMLLHLMKKRWHALWALIIFLGVAAYSAFTGHFTVADSSLGSRMELMLPWQEGYFDVFFPEILEQIRICFLDGGWNTLGRGFLRGLEIILQRSKDPLEKNAYLAPLILVLVPQILLLGRRTPDSDRGENSSWTLLFGFLAFLAPLTPFLVIGNPWFSLRNTVPSFLGLALLLDWLLRKLTKNRTAEFTALFAAVCLVASVSELHDYRLTTIHNERVANAAVQAGEDYSLSGQVGILGLNQTYLPEQNFRYHDHVLGSQGTAWGLSGTVNFYSGAYLPYTATPLPTDGAVFYNAWTEAARDVNRFDHLLLYHPEDGTMELLRRVAGEDGTLLYAEDGTLLARVWKDETKHGRIEFYPESP